MSKTLMNFPNVLVELPLPVVRARAPQPTLVGLAAAAAPPCFTAEIMSARAQLARQYAARGIRPGFQSRVRP